MVDRTRRVAEQVREPMRLSLANMAAIEVFERAADPPVREAIHQLTAPTLVGIAEADPTDFVTIGEYLGAHIPGARTKRFDDTGHLIAAERPAETIEAIIEFHAELD